MKISLQIFYTDGELVEKIFVALQKCLDYIKEEIVDKNEVVDRIVIEIC